MDQVTTVVGTEEIRNKKTVPTPKSLQSEPGLSRLGVVETDLSSHRVSEVS